MLKIAHRGYTKLFSDNSFGAFQDAYYNKFDMIEIDIQLDKYDNIIIIHDHIINQQYINTMSIYDIRDYYPDTLLLSTFFEHFNYKNIKLYFDLKGSNKLAHILHDFLQKNNIVLDNIWLASFNIHHLEILSQKKCYKLGLITDNKYTTDLLQYFINKYNIQFICFSWIVLDKDSIEFLRNKKVLTFAYTLKDIEILPIVQEYNVDGIVTDIIF